MATRTEYLAYKRDTSWLLYWIVRTSNGIFKSAAPDVALPDGDVAASDGIVNITGKVTVANLLTLCRLIAKNLTTIPPDIFRLFRAVIDARTAAHAVFQQIVAASPDPVIEKSNETHRHFLAALTEAFHSLGGKDWKPDESAGASTDGGHRVPQAKEELDLLVLSNRFGALDLGKTGDESSDKDDAAGNDAKDLATGTRGPAAAAR